MLGKFQKIICRYKACKLLRVLPPIVICAVLFSVPWIGMVISYVNAKNLSNVALEWDHFLGTDSTIEPILVSFFIKYSFYAFIPFCPIAFYVDKLFYKLVFGDPGYTDHYSEWIENGRPDNRFEKLDDAEEIKQCHRCKTVRWERTHHCSICDQCVDRYDHHCIWINNCVGVKNQREFILLLVWVTIGLFVLLPMSIAMLWLHFIRRRRCTFTIEMSGVLPEAIGVAWATIVLNCFVGVGALMAGNLWLIANNAVQLDFIDGEHSLLSLLCRREGAKLPYCSGDLSKNLRLALHDGSKGVEGVTVSPMRRFLPNKDDLFGFIYWFKRFSVFKDARASI